MEQECYRTCTAPLGYFSTDSQTGNNPLSPLVCEIFCLKDHIIIIIIIIIIIKDERIRVTLSHGDVAGALYIIKQACCEHWDVRLSAIVLKLVQKRLVEKVRFCLSPELQQ